MKAGLVAVGEDASGAQEVGEGAASGGEQGGAQQEQEASEGQARESRSEGIEQGRGFSE